MTVDDVVDRFEMLEVPELEPPLLVVTAWRESKGTKVQRGYTERSKVKRRLCWAPAEVADLAGVPLRTVYEWARVGLVEPTYERPELGIIEPRYCWGDLVNLRLVDDLRQAGVDRAVQQLAADHCASLFGHFNFPNTSAESMFDLWDRWFFPADVATAELLQAEYLGVLVLPTQDPEDRQELIEHPDLALTEYPIHRRVDELNERAAAWWRKAGQERQPWL